MLLALLARLLACPTRGHDVYGAPCPTCVLTPSGAETTWVPIPLPGDARSLSLSLADSGVWFRASRLWVRAQGFGAGLRLLKSCFCACTREHLTLNLKALCYKPEELKGN